MITTERLELVPATIELTRAALEGEEALRAALQATIPQSWPPEYLDRAAFEFILDRLGQGPEQAGWWLYFVVLRTGASRTLIGGAGYKGPPTAEGMVEVGYGIVGDQQRRGYGSEVVRGLVSHAFALPAVRRVIAETLPALVGSMGLLQKCGFRLIGEGSEPGVVRFELSRADHDSRERSTALPR